MWQQHGQILPLTELVKHSLCVGTVLSALHALSHLACQRLCEACIPFPATNEPGLAWLLFTCLPCWRHVHPPATHLLLPLPGTSLLLPALLTWATLTGLDGLSVNVTSSGGPPDIEQGPTVTTMRSGKICHPKICHFGIKVIFS